MKLVKCSNTSCRVPKSARLSLALKAKKPPKKEIENISKKLKKTTKGKKEAKAKKQEQCMEPKEDAVFVLNDDCFEKIFRFLNMHDLINLVKASPQFQPNACTAFRLLYPREVITVYVRPNNMFIMRLNCVNLYSEYTFPEMLEFFRNFGAAISVLEIEDGPFMSDILEPLLKAICKHCAKTLTCLRFNKLTFTSKILTSLQPLGPTLRRLVLVESNLNLLTNRNIFQQFFNVSVLNLFRVSFDAETIMETFPNLREFTASHLGAIKDQHMIEFCHRNPQLTSLHINHCANITQNVFQTITNHLPLLTELDIRMKSGICNGQFQQYPLNLPNLQVLSLQGFVYLDDYLHEMASICQELKSINLFDIKDTTTISTAISRFADYRNLTHLQFFRCFINSEHLEQITRSAPNLVQVDLNLPKIVDFDFLAIIRLVGGCKQLITLKINAPKVRMLEFNCEILHELLDTIEKRTEESTKKVTIYGRDGLYVKCPTDHLKVYRDRLKIEPRENIYTLY